MSVSAFLGFCNAIHLLIFQQPSAQTTSSPQSGWHLDLNHPPLMFCIVVNIFTQYPLVCYQANIGNASERLLTESEDDATPGKHAVAKGCTVHRAYVLYALYI